jgi:F420-dependent oxidoreductase-like protein
MRIGVAFDHMAHPRHSLDLAVALEHAGADEVWIPETWGFDAATLAGAVAARTSRLTVGAVLPVFSRSPALIAQTVAGLDAISGGRATVALGTSGPQVVEGWHGVPFARPLGALREVIDACQQVLGRKILELDGPRPVPLPEGRGTGLGKPLRMVTRPARDHVPIVLVALAPGAVRLAAEAADGWWPLFASPDAIRGQWGTPLREGRERRDRALGPLGITVSCVVWVGEGEGEGAARAAARREIAFYVGSMGSRERNYYRDAVEAMGFGREANAIQQAALDGRRRDAEDAVTDDLVDALAMIGDRSRASERLASLAAAGATTIVLSAATPDPVRAVTELRDLLR